MHLVEVEAVAAAAVAVAVVHVGPVAQALPVHLPQLRMSFDSTIHGWRNKPNIQKGRHGLCNSVRL
jgi:hypothetical protein